MGVATKDDVEKWLTDIGLKSLEKTDTGNWYFLQKSDMRPYRSI